MKKINTIYFFLFVVILLFGKNNKCYGEVKFDSINEWFFKKSIKLNPEIETINYKLKNQNKQINFVNKLPGNFGRPQWDKVEIINFSSFENKKNKNIKEREILIPTTNDSNVLTGILCLKEMNGKFLLKSLTNQDLYLACYNQKLDTTEVRNLLSLFLFMNYKVTSDSIFNNIPKKIFTTTTLPFNKDETISIIFKPFKKRPHIKSLNYINVGDISYIYFDLHFKSHILFLNIASINNFFNDANSGFSFGNSNKKTCPFYITTCYQLSQHEKDIWKKLEEEDRKDEEHAKGQIKVDK